MFSNQIHRLINKTITLRPLHLSPNILTSAELDLNYLCDPKKIPEIAQNIIRRKGIGDINEVHALKHQLEALKPSDTSFKATKTQLHAALLKIPNITHPDVQGYGNDPKIVREVGSKKVFSTTPKNFQEITKRLKLVRTEHLGNLSGSKSYYILGELAELEHALIRYFVGNLLKNQFQLISVPDILPRDVVEGCGMNTRGDRTQVYTLDPALHGPDLCLSGTSEIAMAGYLSKKVLKGAELPLRLAAVSRCYRAETSNLMEERGIYRVHEFTKVEMFIAAPPSQSEEILEEIRSLQEKSFESLGLHFQVLDMPPHELGAQAYRKYDMEAWMPGRQLYGEISSCSNCLDYQSRRLQIKYRRPDGGFGFVHTLNGTAVAIPRLLIALVEGGQNSNGTISVPEVLWGLMGGKKVIGKQKGIPELKLIKNKKHL